MVPKPPTFLGEESNSGPWAQAAVALVLEPVAVGCLWGGHTAVHVFVFFLFFVF